jgi:hypothetical protein
VGQGVVQILECYLMMINKKLSYVTTLSMENYPFVDYSVAKPEIKIPLILCEQGISLYSCVKKKNQLEFQYLLPLNICITMGAARIFFQGNSEKICLQSYV